MLQDDKAGPMTPLISLSLLSSFPKLMSQCSSFLEDRGPKVETVVDLVEKLVTAADESCTRLAEVDLPRLFRCGGAGPRTVGTEPF